MKVSLAYLRSLPQTEGEYRFHTNNATKEQYLYPIFQQITFLHDIYVFISIKIYDKIVINIVLTIYLMRLYTMINVNIYLKYDKGGKTQIGALS